MQERGTQDPDEKSPPREETGTAKRRETAPLPLARGREKRGFTKIN